ncbi:MAG: methylated-DNA--[protein]-cysteine S-methyltransferase [Gemmatimonadetes bacterium]|nr:methylated-DNA--[protein]-cysteine S-methyltransferase [Gemmatimonadota bacterium]
MSGAPAWEDDVLLDLVMDVAWDEAPGGDGSSGEGPRERAGAYEALSRLLKTQRSGDAVRWTEFDTPFGPMYVAATGRGLARVSWQQEREAAFLEELERRWPDRPVIHDAAALAEARGQMEGYFRGERERFDLPVDLADLPPFQRDVLEAVRRVPFGDVVPYAELARRIRRPQAHRAVGNALGRNPVAIVVPCHRVVRSDGSLGGYGGGVEYKKRLLRIEGRADLLRTG